eukprot:376470-Prorocentrum_minimum.AAC.1
MLSPRIRLVRAASICARDAQVRQRIESALRNMRRVFETGVPQAAPEVKAEVAAVIVDAVTVWRTTALVEEPTRE